MVELFVDMQGVVVGLLRDPKVFGVTALLAGFLIRNKMTKLLSAFAGQGRYFAVTIKRKHGYVRVVWKVNGSGRWMRWNISWGKK